MILLKSGNLIGARKLLLVRTLAGSRETLGAQHPDTQRVARLLAEVVAALGGASKKGHRPKAGKKKRR